MSWSDFHWDPVIPGCITTLTTTQLQFDNADLPKQTEARCQGEEHCPGDFPCCIPEPVNQCSAAAPQLFVFGDGKYGVTTVNTGDDACCCAPPPCTCSHVYYICGIRNMAQFCGVFNGEKTASLGQNGKATTTGTAQNIDWMITIPSDYASGNGNWSYIGQQQTGWAHAVYRYDFTDYNNTNAPNGPFLLQQWINDICTGKSTAAPNGMDPTGATRIRDAHVVYAIVLDFYNQMYNDGYYNTHAPDAREPFGSYNFFQFGFSSYTHTMIDNLVGYLNALYPTGVFPDAFRAALQTILVPPLAVQNPDHTYHVSFQLSYPEYQAYLQASDQTAYMNSLLAGMLRDTKAQMGNLVLGRQWSPDNPELANPSLDSITAIQLWDGSSQPSYLITSNIDTTDWNNNWATKYPNYYFATAQVTCTVKKWSPLLAVYFQVFAAATFDNATCQAIANPPDSHNPSTLPISCYQSDCVDVNQCKTDILSYCPMTYVPPPYSSRAITDQYLLSNKYSDCLCYTSALAPISNPTPGNVGAMCFDKYCTPQYRQDFDLNDAKCKGYCETVYDWLTGTGADQSQNASHMDWQRFQQICGSGYKPYSPANFNTGMLVTGAVGSIFLLLIWYAISKHRNYSSSKTKIVMGIIAALGVALTLFLGRDFAGLSNCDYTKHKFECTSRITNRSIPKQFCNYVLNCECAVDQDCPDGCLCASGSCQPQSGKRTFTKVKNRNVPMLIVSIILVVLCWISMFALYKESHWQINKFVLGGILLLLGLAPILYFSLHTISEEVFSESCKKGGACTSDSDCISGSSCIGGQCEALTPGCPAANPVAPPQDVLDTGSYIIQSQERGFYLYPDNDNPAVLSTNVGRCNSKHTSPQVWAYDSKLWKLTSVDSSGITCTLIPYDVCANAGCKGTVYCQDISRVTPQPKFILGKSGTIYNLEAQAYLIPASGTPCQTVPCIFGNCYDTTCSIFVTYTSNVSEASVWTFSPCDPKTTCTTSCGICPEYTFCTPDTLQCTPRNYNLYFYSSPTFSDPNPSILVFAANLLYFTNVPPTPPTPGTGPWVYDPIQRTLSYNQGTNHSELSYNDQGLVIGVSPGYGMKWRVGDDNVIYLDTADNYFLGANTADGVALSSSSYAPPIIRKYVKFFP